MRDITFFDNIPTPIDYRLGPGDQIVISIWGETNSRKNMIIDKMVQSFMKISGL